MSNSKTTNMLNKSLLENLLKCDICNTLFDSSIHIPMVVQCGHTFCKNCLLNVKNSQFCPLDKIKDMLNFDTSIRNLKLEILIQKVFNITSPENIHKIYTKPDIKKIADQKNLNKLTNFEKKIKSRLQKKFAIDDNEKKILNDSKINGNLSNETIETIPINDDKSTVTNSFQLEFADLLNSKNIENDKYNSNSITTRYNIKTININFNTRKSNNGNINNYSKEKENNNIDVFIQKNINNINDIKNNKSENNSAENNNNFRKNIINNYKNNDNENNNKNNNVNNNITYVTKIKKQTITISKNEKFKNKFKNYKAIESEDENEGSCLSSKQLNKLSGKFCIFEIEKENINKRNYINSDINKKNTLTSKNSISNFRGKKLIKSNGNLLATINNIMADDNNIQRYNKKINSNINQHNKNKNYISPINNQKNGILVPRLIFNKKNSHDINSINCSVNDNNNNELSSNEKNIINRSNTMNYYSKKQFKITSGTNSNDKIVIKNPEEKNDYCTAQKTDEIIKKIDINKVKINKLNNKNNCFYKNNHSQNISPLHKNNSSLNSISTFQTHKCLKNNKSFNNNNPLNQKTLTLRNSRRAVTKYENNNDTIKTMISKVKINVCKKLYHSKRGSIENNNLNFKKDIITKLRKDFQFLFKNENIINKTKYEDMFETALKSPYLSKIISKEKFIDINLFKVCFIKDNNLFIGLFDSEKNLPIKGILQNSIGDHYEGEFVNSKKEGQGKIIYKNGCIYEGTFKNNKHDGFGKIIESGGEFYEGEWKNGKIEGKGTRTHKNGDKYIGEYINNIRNGNGKYFFVNGDYYEGMWENGKANGYGKFKFRNGEIYEGEFKNNLICGKGKLIKKNGDIYQGEFFNGLIQGKGNIIKENGDKFIGYFVNGKKNGLGKLVDKNGKVIKIGNWKMDEFISNNNNY